MTERDSWGALFRGKNGLYTALVFLGVVLYSIQTLVVVTIMPTVVGEIGGASYYVWASMLFMVGTIVGAASVGPTWAAMGARRLFLLAGSIFAVGTLGCALSADMLVLVVARGVQGYGGGLITGGTMGLVSRLFAASQRTRVLALWQGAWTVCSLLGPLYGGAFAEIGWWRGSFWTFMPMIFGFCFVAWWKLPDDRASGRRTGGERLPLLRLSLLALGVTSVAEAGQLHGALARSGALLIAAALIVTTFKLDASAPRRLFPSQPMSISHPVGLGYWVLVLGGAVQAAVTIFIPLELQVVHEVTPLLVGMPSLILSLAWTIATFMVSGWSGARERFALNSGPVFMLIGVGMLLFNVYGGSVPLLMVACFVLGFGIGIHNVHLVARIMEHAKRGEEAVTASSQSMIRPMGMAIGTAAAGMVANMAGLAGSIEKSVVSDAVAAVMLCSLPALVLALFFIVRLSALVVAPSRRARAGN
jgi:MFS family permease